MDDTEAINKQLKVLIIGDSCVGKTAFLFMYSQNKFSSAYTSTVGVDFVTKVIHRGDKAIKLQIWDTAGQERYRAISIAYYRGADGFAVVFDLTNRESFQNCVKWIDSIRENGDSGDIPIVLVGNKSDLATERIVTTDEAKEFASISGIEYFETSAKDNINVTEVFDRIVDDCFKPEKTKPSPDLVKLEPTEELATITVSADNTKPSSSCWC